MNTKKLKIVLKNVNLPKSNDKLFNIKSLAMLTAKLLKP